MNAVLASAFDRGGAAIALESPAGPTSYRELAARAAAWASRLEASGVRRGAVVALDGDFSAESIAALGACEKQELVVVPLVGAPDAMREHQLEAAAVEAIVRADAGTIETMTGREPHPLLRELRRREHAGLVLFSSGSTGKPKAAVLDLTQMMSYFRPAARPFRMLAFLLFDHIGGLNTLCYSLVTGGTLVAVAARTPDTVAAAIAAHRVDLLSVSPTFLNLLLVSGAVERHDLSSLRIVQYSTEALSSVTLARLRERLPEVRLEQAYGMTELGPLRIKTRPDDPQWIRIEDEAHVRVRGGLLEVKSRGVALGYLNAPDPFTDDGWLKTGDLVEVDGEWMRVRGRATGMINVGGNKVHPEEVESVLVEMDGVIDVAVHGEPNALVGAIVVARVVLSSPDETSGAFANRMRAFCAARLPRHQIPQKVIVAGALHGRRMKKLRG